MSPGARVPVVFVFEQTWSVPAPPEEVYAVLADPEGYPRWWPEVRGAGRVDGERGRVRIRSRLPYTLDLVLTRQVEDPVTRVLRVSIEGDLRGWAQWRVEAHGSGGTLARYDQEAVVAVRGLSRWARLVGPLLRANHSAMMRSGERGLRDWCAGGQHPA